MPRSDLVSIDITKVTTFEAILTELRSLDKLLSHDSFNQFIVFNKAYYVVTRTIKEAADNNYFEHPTFIEKFTIHFASYYFQALNYTAADDPDLPMAWAKMNKISHNKSVPAFITLLMGANAHINHDLPLALLQLVDKDGLEDMSKDILKIDALLMKSSKEILKIFNEPHTALDFIKRRLQFVYYRPIMYMILSWRVIAWHNYKAIKENGIQKNNYRLKSIKIANRFLVLGGFLR